MCCTGRVLDATSEIDLLTERIIGCAIEVHRTLGPGLLESVYRTCLISEMVQGGLQVQSQTGLQEAPDLLLTPWSVRDIRCW